MAVPMCPTVFPTMEEWQRFEGVIRIAEAAAASTGIVKIVPPQSWAALARLEREESMELPLPGDESTEIGRLACGAKSGGSFSRKQGGCSSRQEDPELTAGKDFE